MSCFSRHFSQPGVLPVSLLVCLSLSSFAVVAEEVEVTAEVAKLLALQPRYHGYFGHSVSLDGDRLAIGAYGDGGDSGSAYVFERDVDGSWVEVSKLFALDGQGGDSFGLSVSLDGDRLAIGAYGDYGNGSDSGSVYLFERDADGSWLQVSKLLAVDGQAFDSFGWSVSLDGERLAIGAFGDDDNGDGSGSAYVFERDVDGSWVEVSKLLALDGHLGDAFGVSVSLDGDRLAIGAHFDDDNGSGSGSAYVFERDVGGSWVEVNKLLALDGRLFDQFGRSVSLDGERLAIGAHFDDDNGSASGSANVFERDVDGSWVEVSKLLPLDGHLADAFGVSVSLDGDRLAIGAYLDDDIGSGSGSAYVFERDVGGSWVEVSKLVALDGQAFDSFGWSVSLDGDRLAVGADLDNDNLREDTGSAYVFESVLVSPQLTLSGTCPGEVELASSDTTPRSGIRLYSSTAPGTWTFGSGPCEGTSLRLDEPTLMGQTKTDFDAENSRVRTVDASKCGTYLQVIDLKTCLTSEVVQVP